MVSAKKKSSAAPKAVSIWADHKTRQLYKRVTKRSNKALSEVVRVLVGRYDKVGKAPGLPRLTAVKKSPKRKPKVAALVAPTPVSA